MKFFGAVGFVLPAVEDPEGSGIWVETVVEHNYYGDILRPARQLEGGEKINNDLSVNNSVSIVADAFANENFTAIRYVRWMGGLWTVPNAEVQVPRLVLRLGGKYNGSTPETP